MTMANDAEAGGLPRRDPRQDPSFDPAGLSKRLLRSIRSGALATLSENGGPFATLTAVATDYDGSPILLMSRLAIHTRNLERDGRCSLLLAQSGRGDPLAHPRLTLVVEAARTGAASARARFLRRNPKAALYADFPDFSFWRARVTGVHLNGGFGRAADFGPEGLLTKIEGAEPLIEAEESILDHLNGDDADTLALLAQKYAGEGAGQWRASGVDPDGLDLICGDGAARVVFPRRVETPGDVSDILLELSRAPKVADFDN